MTTTTNDNARKAVEEGDLIYKELKVLATTLVRAVKDEDTPHAELLLLQHLLDVRVQAQEEIWARVDGALHPEKRA